MPSSTHRIETIIRTDSDVAQVLCSTELQLLSGPTALEEHIAGLQALAEDASEGRGLPSSVSEEVDDFWDSYQPGKVREELAREKKEIEANYQARIGNLKTRLQKVEAERDDFRLQATDARDEVQKLRSRLEERQVEEELMRNKLGELKSRLEKVQEERNRLAHLNQSGSVTVIRQWIHDGLIKEPHQVAQKLLGEGITSAELANWANEEGYDTSPRSLGNTISKHPRLQEIFETKEDTRPAKWIIDLRSTDSGDLRWLLGSTEAHDFFIEAAREVGIIK